MSYRLEIGLVLLIATAVGVAVFAANRTPKPVEPDRRASTYLSGPDGSQALYRVMVRLGRPMERRRTTLFGFSGDTTARRTRASLLVVLNPPISLDDVELDEVVAFVAHGGAVIAAGHGGGITRCAGWRREPEGYVDDSSTVKPIEENGARLQLPRAARVLVPRHRDARLSALVKRGVATENQACDTLAPVAQDTLVAAMKGQPVVLRLRYASGGTITLAADAGWFRNRVWRNTDVPYVVLPILMTTGRGRVVWDEYHQGFARETPGVAAVTWEWALRSPVGWAILQLVAVGLVWLAVTAVRFGPARAVIERRRRSPLEHLEALAAGLEGAEETGVAVQRIVAGLRRRLSRTGHVGGADLNAWLESVSLATTTPRGRGAVLRLRAILNQLNQRGGAPEQVLATAQAVEDVWEELRPRTTRDAF